MNTTNRNLIAALAFIVSFFSFQNSYSQLWQTVGIEGFSVAEARHADISIDNNNIPYVAFCDSLYGYKATVMKFDGTNWVNVGSPGFSNGPASHFDFMSLAFDSNNLPYISYEDSSLATKAVVKKFDGTNWIPVGVEGFSAGMCASVSIAIDSSDTPYVVYKDYAAGGNAAIKKFDGINWISVGSSPATSSIDHTWIRFDSNNNPMISYADNGATTDANVKTFDGVSWNSVGTADFAGQMIWYPYLAIDNNDTPYMIFNYYSTIPGPFFNGAVMKFDGTSWVTVGASSFPNFIGPAPKMIFDSQNNPYVIYTDSTNSYGATVITFDGTNWVNVGNAGFSNSGIAFPDIAIDTNDLLYVSYSDGSFAGKLTVKSFSVAAAIMETAGRNDEINIYPNPSTESVNIKFNDITENGFIQIIDHSGRIVYEANLTQTQTAVNVKNLANGIYILKITKNKSLNSYKKLVIQH